MLSANQIEDIKCQAYKCLPSKLGNICEVRPLTVVEILKMGISTYQQRLGILLLTEVEIAEIIKEKSKQELPPEEIEPLTYLIQSADKNDTFFLELELAFSTFIQEEVMVLPKINAILVGPPEERRLITSENFRDFQDILKIQNHREVKEPPPEDETPGQRKMRLLREKVAAVKKKRAQKDGEGQSLLDLLEIADVFGIDTNKCSLFSFYNLIRRHQLKEKWDQDIQMLCAGADSNQIKTQYWGESSKIE